ncbi:MAG: helix-turn-helix transcriptional regulator [Oscillospiraceae bacterium]|nr:helix-turn-helix transcriptional regulator [Oscillospiraceae bacterium]
MEKQTLGQKIFELRKAKNMTQLELANQLNITDKAVSKWERDISCPDINTFPKLAEILGVSVDELLQANASGKENNKKEDTSDMLLKVIPLALSIGVTVLTAIDQIYWEDAVSLLGLAVLAIAVRNFREKQY